MKEVIDLINSKIIIFKETLRKYEILQQGMIEDSGEENSSVKIMISDYKERIKTYENAIKILSNEREADRKHEQQERSCSTCKYEDGFRCKHPDNCEGDYENWEQL